MIRYSCPRCKAPLETFETRAGREDFCPVCGKPHRVPALVQWDCPRCHARLESPERFCGRIDTCPKCGTSARVPLSDRLAQAARQKTTAAERAENEARKRQEKQAKRERERLAAQRSAKRASEQKEDIPFFTEPSPRPVTAKPVMGGELLAPEGTSQNALPVPQWAFRLTDELKRDLDRLSELGVNLDKAAAIAKPAGIAAGVAAGFRIHPLLGAAIAGAGLLARFATDAWKQAEINSVREKWWRKLTGMNEKQITAFMCAMQKRYPLLLPATVFLLAPPQ